MATTAPSTEVPEEPVIAPLDSTNSTRPEPQPAMSVTPLGIGTLASNPTAISSNNQASSSSQKSPGSRPTPAILAEKSSNLPVDASTNLPQSIPTSTSAAESEPNPTPLGRAYSTAIGPSSDQPMPIPKDESSGPTLIITLLLTTGARHPFKLDQKYLLKRNVEVQGNDPFNLSVYKLKELILREWRDEWEQKPSSPSSIRLISFGKLLDDKAPLKDSKFNHDAPNVVHMTVKPQEFIDEEDTKGSKGGLGSGGEAGERSPGCRCTVM